MPYILWNQEDKKPLKHPSIGIWNTVNKLEAQEALQDLYQYLESTNRGHLKDRFVISTIESIKSDI